MLGFCCKSFLRSSYFFLVYFKSIKRGSASSSVKGISSTSLSYDAPDSIFAVSSLEKSFLMMTGTVPLSKLCRLTDKSTSVLCTKFCNASILLFFIFPQHF